MALALDLFLEKAESSGIRRGTAVTKEDLLRETYV
jgi:hypothetical protein